MKWTKLDDNTLICEPYMILKTSGFGVLTYLAFCKQPAGWELLGGMGCENGAEAKAVCEKHSMPGEDPTWS